MQLAEELKRGMYMYLHVLTIKKQTFQKTN